MTHSADLPLVLLDDLDDAQLDAIAGIHLSAPMEWGERNYDSPQARAGTVETWTGPARDRMFLAAILDGDQPLAFLWASTQPDPTLHVQIYSLWVSKTLRRQGVATRLKLALEDWARTIGAESIQTDVHHDNAAVIGLNEALGYEVVASPLASDGPPRIRQLKRLSG